MSPRAPGIAESLPLAYGVAALLEGDERRLADELAGLAETYVEAAPRDELEFRRSMNRLVELLARRRARAMPLAAFGRAVLADLGNDERESARLVREFETKVALLGLL